MPTRIPETERERYLSTLPDWRYLQDRGGLIARDYRFENFVSAFEFMRQMASFSEQIQHHPEWSNVYQRVSVVLTTHDAGGLTALDIQWATKADTVASAIGKTDTSTATPT